MGVGLQQNVILKTRNSYVRAMDKRGAELKTNDANGTKYKFMLPFNMDPNRLLSQ